MSATVLDGEEAIDVVDLLRAILRADRELYGSCAVDVVRDVDGRLVSVARRPRPDADEP